MRESDRFAALASCSLGRVSNAALIVMLVLVFNPTVDTRAQPARAESLIGYRRFERAQDFDWSTVQLRATMVG
jgi:hypothetical protein